MKKPSFKTKQYLDYDGCADFIASKLGVKDLRDFAGKYSAKEENVSHIPYQDFWHVMLEHNDVNHGGDVFMPYALKDEHKWAQPIVDAFNEEFGEGREYWVEW